MLAKAPMLSLLPAMHRCAQKDTEMPLGLQAMSSFWSWMTQMTAPDHERPSSAACQLPVNA